LILGNSYLYQQKFAPAQKQYESIIEKAPDSPIGYFRLGYLQRIRGQYDAALENFKKALSINPNLMDVFTNVVAVHVARNEFDAAVAECQQQLERMADKPKLASLIYNLQAGVYLAADKKSLAQQSFEKAVELNADNLKAYYALAGLYLSENKQEQAIAQYKALLEVNPKQPTAHMLLAAIYDLQDRFDQSEKHYRAALDINPDFVAAANNLAYILADHDKDIDDALKYARLAKEKLPNDPNVMDTLGWVYYKKALYDSAIDEFTGCLEKMPDNPTVIYHLGMAYYKKGEFEKARTELQKALELDKNFAEANEAERILAEL